MIKKLMINIYEKLLRKYTYIKDKIVKKKIGVPKVMTMDETMDYIIKRRCSVSRYGDGELKLISGEDIRFQKCNLELSRRLAEILKGNGNTLVCISNIFDTPNWMNEKAYEYTWRIVAKNRKLWTSHLNLEYLYGNAFISRPYFDWKEQTNAIRWFNKLKQIWNNHDIVFIEGCKSRLGYNNDLFQGAKSVKRILCPAQNAYIKYTEILKEAEKQPKEVLFLLACGPTATILAEDLAKDGYWAIDIGHIDIEYEWFKMKATEKLPVKNKYTNEAVGGDQVKDDIDDGFRQEVIAEIL